MPDGAGEAFEGDVLTFEDALNAVRVLREANVPTFAGYYWISVRPESLLGQEIAMLRRRLRRPGGRKYRSALRRWRALMGDDPTSSP